MKKRNIISAAILGLLLMLIFTGCGPKGGTLTFINESTYEITGVKISFGESRTDSLKPGEWIKAGVDKNRSGNVSFDLSYNFLNENPKNMVEVPTYGGSFILGHFTSGLIAVSNGEAVIVTLRNIQP